MASSTSALFSSTPVLAALVCAGWLVASPAMAAPPANLDAQVKRAMDAFGAPGLSLAIVEDGKPVVARGYGIRRLNTKNMVDEHTAFPIGSESKAFTAAALAILVDRKKLKWDDRVVDKLPGFAMYDPYATAHMTVRDLLTHRSGLGLGEGDLLIVPDTNRSRADIVHALRYLKPVTGFRETFAYDNILYIVAGALVEAVSGQTWEAFVHDNIFVPAGLNDAHANYEAKAANAVALHARIHGLFRGIGEQSILAKGLEPHASAPAGAINASATDMGRWMAVLLAGGRLPNGKRLWSDAAAKEMWTPVVVVNDIFPAIMKPMSPDMQDYALGWFVESYRGHQIVQHSGAVLGALAVLYMIPEKHVGISITINSEDSGTRRAMLYTLLDHYLGLKPRDWVAEMQRIRATLVAQTTKALKAMPKPDTANNGAKASLPLPRYAGVYQDPWYGTMTIHDRGAGKLWLTFDRTPGMEGALEHVSGDKFRTRWTDTGIEDAFVTFAVKNGAIGPVKMQAISPAADFSFDYQDLHFAKRP